MYDLHIHTKNSHDSEQTLDEVCTFAIEKGLKGIAICDHVDMWFAKDLNTCDMMKTCIKEVKEAQKKYEGKLKIFQGVEMAEYLFDEKGAKEIMELCDYDVILGSVHSVKCEGFDDSYSRVDLSEKISKEIICAFLTEYFSKITEMIEKTDIDVLSHLTCPMRYINGKYKRNINIFDFKKEIENILYLIIKKEIALEVNTSNIDGPSSDFMPESEIIKLYNAMGGCLLTIGSDAHVPKRVGNAFNRAKRFLKETGFTHYYYYEKRKPVSAELF